MKIKNQKTKIKIKGFTVAELLVAVAIFMTVISIAIASFTRSLRIQRAITMMMAINDNASLTLEQMMREIRVGEQFESSEPPEPSRLSFIRYISGQPVKVSYQFNNNAIERGEGVTPAYAPISASNVKIKYLKFILSAGVPWRVTIAMGVGSASPDLANVVTNIQTTVSARNL